MKLGPSPGMRKRKPGTVEHSQYNIRLIVIDQTGLGINEGHPEMGTPCRVIMRMC